MQVKKCLEIKTQLTLAFSKHMILTKLAESLYILFFNAPIGNIIILQLLRCYLHLWAHYRLYSYKNHYNITKDIFDQIMVNRKKEKSTDIYLHYLLREQLQNNKSTGLGLEKIYEK